MVEAWQSSKVFLVQAEPIKTVRAVTQINRANIPVAHAFIQRNRRAVFFINIQPNRLCPGFGGIPINKTQNPPADSPMPEVRMHCKGIKHPHLIILQPEVPIHLRIGSFRGVAKNEGSGNLPLLHRHKEGVFFNPLPGILLCGIDALFPPGIIDMAFQIIVQGVIEPRNLSQAAFLISMGLSSASK